MLCEGVKDRTTIYSTSVPSQFSVWTSGKDVFCVFLPQLAVDVDMGRVFRQCFVSMFPVCRK